MSQKQLCGSLSTKGIFSWSNPDMIIKTIPFSKKIIPGRAAKNNFKKAGKPIT